MKYEKLEVGQRVKIVYDKNKVFEYKDYLQINCRVWINDIEIPCKSACLKFKPIMTLYFFLTYKKEHFFPSPHTYYLIEDFAASQEMKKDYIKIKTGSLLITDRSGKIKFDLCYGVNSYDHILINSITANFDGVRDIETL